MNTSFLKESDYKMKREDDNNQSKSLKPDLTTSSWSRLKDPRIVRVSRAFGGKDRHSKVCTVKGLRDRRVRLSVPTAIQLYDLQDRLGLNQPSKAVDWLLDAAKHEIDELPPLHIPPGIFGQNVQAMMNASSQETSARTNGLNPEDYWNPERSRSIAQETSKNCEGYDQEDARNKHILHGTFMQSNNNSSLPCLLNNAVPNSSFLKWDPSNLSLSRFGSYGSVTHDQHQDTNLLYPSPGPPPPQTQSYFPSHDHRAGEFDPKQLNFQMLSSSSSSSNFTPFHLSMNPKLFSSEDDGGHVLNK